MKQAIIALSVILLVLLVLAGVFLFVLDGMIPEETQPALPETTAEPTAPPTEPTLPETEAPTEPEPVLAEAEGTYVLDGTALTAYGLDGVDVVRADDFLAAAGLDAGGTAHASLKSLVQCSEGTVTIAGTVYDTTVDGAVYLPIAAAAEAMGYPAYLLDETTYYTLPCSVSKENINVPVLMYHAVSDNCWGIDELFVSPSSMDEQLKYLTENGYDAIWFEDLSHLEDYEKPVILTFDDGYDDNYLELLPLLQKYNVKATVFVIGNAPGVIQHKMTPEQIREMSDSGLVSIQSHGYTHDDMDAMDAETTDYELSESQKAITRITGKVPRVLCYPTGKYNDNTLSIIGTYYDFGIKMVGGLYNTSDDPFLVSRYYVSRYTDLSTFASYLSAAGT